MKLPRLLLLSTLALSCAKTLEGPTPTISAVVNPNAPDATPAVLCNAQAPDTGWRLEIRGDNFSPLPADVLTDKPQLLMPAISLRGPGSFDLPADRVSFASKQLLVAQFPTANTQPPATLEPGTYSLTLQNPNGEAATASDSLLVVPPPTFVSVTAPNGFGVGVPNQLLITGSGFRTGAPPKIELSGANLPTVALTDVTVLSATQVSGNVPADTPAGTYDLTLTNPEGCSFTQPAAVTIQYLVLGTLTIDPRFGWQLRNQAITLYNSFTGAQKSFSGGAPEVWITAALKVDPATAVDIPLRRVAYVSPGIITAVVPDCSGNAALPITDAACPNGIVAGGPYALRVKDPSGATGTIPAARGFVVLDNAPPVITAISPEAITTNGIPSTIATELVVTGQHFGAGAKVQLLEQLAGGKIRACNLPGSGTPTDTELRATVPTSIPQANCTEYDAFGAPSTATGGLALSAGLYVVRVQNATDPAYADFSGLVVTNPSANPEPGPAITTRLATARFDFPLVTATNDLGQTFQYALGGSDGTNALSSVEVAPITLFGDLGGDCTGGTCKFRTLDRTALSSARRGLQAVVRTVANDTSYIFVVGGQQQDGTALTTVERAQVLKTSDAPVMQPPSVSTDGGTIGSGTYYYQVSAVMGATLADGGTDVPNPNGETLPSDEYPVTLTGQNTGVATLSWSCVPDATKYRIYRTASANAPSGTEVLLKEVNATVTCSTPPFPMESFIDFGSDTPGTQKPLPTGALGNWVAQPDLTVQRTHSAAILYGDRLIVTGGSCSTVSASCPSAGSTLASAEVASFAPNTATLGNFGSFGTMANARQRHRLTIADKTSAPASFTSTANNLQDAWLLVVGGDQGNAPISNVIEAAKIKDASGDIAAPSFSNTTYNVSPMHGGWTLAIANILFAVGDGGGGQLRAKSNYVCRVGGGPGACSGINSFNATLNDVGGISYQTGAGTRYLGGMTLLRAYIYVAGGVPTDASTMPANTLDRIIY